MKNPFFLTSALLLVASSSFAQEVPVYDAREVEVTKIEVKINRTSTGMATNASTIIATVSYYAGCQMTEALIVTDDHNFNYHIYSANGRARDGKAHCNALFAASKEIKVGMFGGPRPENITINGQPVKP